MIPNNKRFNKEEKNLNKKIKKILRLNTKTNYISKYIEKEKIFLNNLKI